MQQAKNAASAAPIAAEPALSQMVQEYVDSAGQRLAADPRRGVLRGVKLLGLQSRNGRVYREEALRSAMHLYDGAKVNVNHPSGNPLAARDYRDRLGMIRNVSLRTGEGLFGDLHYNPRHALAEQLAWDAEHAPENVGLSHNVAARTRREGEQLVVEAIARVHSVDLVADPATTSGLFEQTESLANSATPTPTSSPHEELDALREEVAALRRAELVRRVLEENGLGGATELGVDDRLLASLEAATDEDTVRALIADRAELMRALQERLVVRPTCESREAEPLGGPGKQRVEGVAGFVAAVTGR
ncbi:hypothetical protein [Botrimarina hoheduenensis]|uniref:Uncharacterized protein n=1 Tax=Botrimarina hoheduenensis TaxID=2528000 RepID=A0A5C5W6H9_9BACT|nr:hypothetical protein [Botrimarina hoheduenensis]TWT46496.1 hypothetical protein Pla111_15920 [Botrimarina hoheduenensis]